MRLLVVGGGITGLAAAWEAVRGAPDRAPAEVLLVDASERLGGKLETEAVDGLLIEHGPDSFVSYRPAALQLATEVGLGDEVISTTGTRTVYLRSRGKLRPLPAGMGMVLPNRIGPFVTTGILSPADKLRAGIDLLLPRQLREGEDVAVGAFLRARLGGGIVRRFADPMIGGIYGASVDELSLDAVLPSLRADEDAHRSLMLAAIAQGRKARASGRGPGSPFRTLRHGLGSLVDAVAGQLAAAGVDLRLGTSVTELRPLGNGAQVRLSDGTTETVDAVILAGGVRSSARLLAEAAPAASAALSQTPLATSTVVSLAYPASAFDQPLTSHGWLEADASPISGVTVSSAKWAERAPEGLVLIRAFVPERLGAIASAPEAELLAAVTTHIGAVLGLREAPVLIRAKRWQAMMPKYTVGHPARVRQVDEGLAHLPGWRVAGSALRGVGVPDCVADGRRQAEQVLGRTFAGGDKVGA
ncbi:MAG TPA: protoporphyrinogen oxidase [Propionicimonas sp.]|nr:protoporphyrinogen oxidase [Propionicimonas sp.]HRA06545.1 protoporphyrinogen oxidase [Propionicimonas sp.]